MDLNVIWVTGLSVVTSITGWVLKEKAAELQRLSVLINRTREEMARDYVTKVEVHADINRVLDRIDKLGEKMDRIMEFNNAK